MEGLAEVEAIVARLREETVVDPNDPTMQLARAEVIRAKEIKSMPLWKPRKRSIT